MIYKLDKASMPGWTFITKYPEHLVWMLEQHICNSCKWTREDYDAYTQTDEFEGLNKYETEIYNRGQNPYTMMDFWPKPEDYKALSDKEKIDLLLSTACGCEFWLDEEEGVPL